MMDKIKLLILLFPLNILFGCEYDKFNEPAYYKKSYIAANIDIGYVRSLYSTSRYNIFDDLILGGYVIAEDRSGNFYRTFIIDDGTGAIEVMAGTYHLFNLYPVGRYVAVKANGLRLTDNYGVLRIGLPYGNKDVAYFGYRSVLENYVYRADDFTEVEPLVRRPGELNEDDCGRLVRIENLYFDRENNDDSQVWAEPGTTTGYRIFRTPAGDLVGVAVSGYASFASYKIPDTVVNVTGILMKRNTENYGELYLLKPRTLADVEQISGNTVNTYDLSGVDMLR